ncbi:UDP-N-acetylmuramoyl-tripeptide--D-alanyl-D-alanine ligase [Shewanella dokdonensis]|uniref:UDP-N-acetylmuramoyl-tripeptide--D-alanyl-D-alanine ligase n=1 Tax=Shewanella dokdonensis TaxID=712036 RepID=A0ABX8DHT2_9GAMM|nr:UDP-N-acetylmuramoyl-tripeptide--D-alanyl-D-alanine ligase [Shewanella dokdonensis]MCL1076434.1 UDP-N-acetylmuramoyl-tripeptide--D-alanyl-D-alanine ligase [Shewanella dokdonensis]QVK24329.1 UDP-N-acetylmuramoyl-tripeptide--D-alanyl-D-alanine ligase [Shewanella dokdonensis]
MIPLTLGDIATAVAGQLPSQTLAEVQINSVSTDSRNITTDCLFIALPGERFDGHDYAPTAVSAGATALLVSKLLPLDIPQVLVADTHKALGQLGALVRNRVNPRCVALTGSNGKTSVKEMVATILSQLAPVLYTSGNFNNDIGVPLTALRLEPQHQFAVFELGANHPGEIDYTSAIVRPEVALVNNVGSAHLAGFGSEAGVAAAKSEIFRHLQPQGIAVINADDHYAQVMQEAAAGHQQLTFAVDTNAQLTAANLQHDANGCYRFELHWQAQVQPVVLPLAGRHQVHNALAAAGLCLGLGLTLTDIANGLAAMQPVKGRMQPKPLGRFMLVDDSYNANPNSVTAAINWLQEIDGNRILVLGDLGELGDNAAPLHRELGERARKAGIDALFCCGELTKHTSAAFATEHYQAIESLVDALIKYLNRLPGKVTVLVKGSRSSRMERVVEALVVAFGRGELV